jgi:hypothetical protein
MADSKSKNSTFNLRLPYELMQQVKAEAIAKTGGNRSELTRIALEMYFNREKSSAQAIDSHLAERHGLQAVLGNPYKLDMSDILASSQLLLLHVHDLTSFLRNFDHRALLLQRLRLPETVTVVFIPISQAGQLYTGDEDLLDRLNDFYMRLPEETVPPFIVCATKRSFSETKFLVATDEAVFRGYTTGEFFNEDDASWTNVWTAQSDNQTGLAYYWLYAFNLIADSTTQFHTSEYDMGSFKVALEQLAEQIAAAKRSQRSSR